LKGVREMEDTNEIIVTLKGVKLTNVPNQVLEEMKQYINTSGELDFHGAYVGEFKDYLMFVETEFQKK
jgi:hypothetical protein